MSSRNKIPGDYTVGYGKPPVHTRFVKGQSGNPRGRPKSKPGVGAKALAREEGGDEVQSLPPTAPQTGHRIFLFSLFRSLFSGNSAGREKGASKRSPD
jgi:hypothetical protein